MQSIICYFFSIRPKINLIQEYSFVMFSKNVKVLCQNTTASSLIAIVNQTFKEEWGDDQTCLYDTIANSMHRVQKQLKSEDVSRTLFIVVTDGADTNSSISLEKIIDMIKTNGTVHLIIMSINQREARSLQKIIAAAKFGRLIEIGDDKPIKDIQTAFTNLNDMLVVLK